MRISFFFLFRLLFAWVAALLGLLILWNSFSGDGPHWVFVLAGFVTLGFVLTGAFSHLRRVRLIADNVDKQALANRQRRQIEVPFDADDAFQLLDATVRELPRIEEVESAHDSLQIRAKVTRINPYSKKQPSRFNPLYWVHIKRNQVLATVTPGSDASRITLICEPESGPWSDWFKVDDGTNLENIEAITRAISRRIAERRRNEQEFARQTSTEKELTVAKLNLLHAQVEPHFLYNTLANAQYLTRNEPARADEMLGNLITYLRHSLPRTEDSLSTLGEELERARAYLDILKIRMGSRLNLQVEMSESEKFMPFPSMMLQTLVENSIKHGLEPKSGGGTIWIIARTDGITLSVTVADDGQGFGVESSGTGIGLKNIRERLQLAYGAAASFQIVANFPEGVAATINIPVVKALGVEHA